MSERVTDELLSRAFSVYSDTRVWTGWQAEDEAPANISIGQDIKLRPSGESAPAIRYVKHSIDAGDTSSPASSALASP